MAIAPEIAKEAPTTVGAEEQQGQTMSVRRIGRFRSPDAKRREQGTGTDIATGKSDARRSAGQTTPSTREEKKNKKEREEKHALEQARKKNTHRKLRQEHANGRQKHQQELQQAEDRLENRDNTSPDFEKR